MKMPSGEPDFTGQNQLTIYGATKAANVFYASELGKQVKDAGIVCVSYNPGNLNSDLQRHRTWLYRKLLGIFLYPSEYGAYTELWTGFAKELTTEKNGAYIAPWGRFFNIKPDRRASLKSVEEGGNGKATAFCKWTEEQCEKYL